MWTRIARALIRRYPRAWRDRYELELTGYVEDSATGVRDVLDLARGCLVERARAWLAPEDHPNLAGALLWCLRMVPALAWYAGLLAAGAWLNRNFAEPPTAVVAGALVVVVLLLVAGIRAWTKVFPSVWTEARKPLSVPPRWAVGTGILVFSASFVLIYWADPPGNPPGPLGWFGDFWLKWLVFPPILRKAFDLYWPAGLRMSGQIMRVAGIRERLSWARMELARCESLQSDVATTGLSDSARAVVDDLELQLVDAVDELHGRRAANASSPDDAQRLVANIQRLQTISTARSQLDWSREQRERLDATGESAPVPAPPFQVTPPLNLEDARAELARAREEVQRLESELKTSLAELGHSRLPRS